MFSNQSTDISLNGPCRALDAIRGDRVDNRFAAGTCAINTSLYQGGRNNNNSSKNRLLVIRFNNESNELIIESEFDHFTGSVGAICSHPTDSTLIATATEQGSSASLWKLPLNDSYEESEKQQPQYDNDYENEDYYNNSSKSFKKDIAVDDKVMERVATLQHPDGEASSSTISNIAWRDGDESSGDVLTIDTDGNLTQWDVSFGAADPIKTIVLNQNDNDSSIVPPPRVKWDPHSNSSNLLAASYGTNVSILDWRIDTSIPSGTVDSLKNCHRYGVTDIDYNPNKPYVMATAGKDGLLKFWDLRSTKQQPLLTARGGHSHWVWNVQYNPFHDQLVLSSGTDSVVNLWRLSTISSAPLLTYDDEDDFGRHQSSNKDDNSGNLQDTSAPNARVGRYEHGDSVYAATWGAADAWIYMTVGYDGKAVLHHVPSKEKYKILL